MSQKIHWPENGQAADFSEIVKHVLSALNAFYTLTPKLFKRSVPFQIPKTLDVEATSRISRADIEHAEEQNRKPIHIIIGGAIRLGAHQGYRCESLTRKTNQMVIEGAKLLLQKGDDDSIKEAIKLLDMIKF